MCSTRKTTAFALAPFALAPFALAPFALALVLVLGVFALARPADAANAADAVPGDTSGDGVTPTVESGNSTCADLGYGDYELKVDPPLDGSYTDTDNDIIDFDVQLTGLSDSGAKSFDFLSNMGVDAVLVKGSNSSDIYVYDLTDLTDENKDDTGLSAPRNPDNGQLYGISHIDFCYDLELQVTKDANTSLTRTNDWSIDKSASPSTLNMFTGDSGTSKYTVSLDKTLTDSDFAVNGTIQVKNPAPFDATITNVTDEMSDGTSATVTCTEPNDGDTVISYPYTLGAGKTITCQYEADLLDDLPDDDSLVNTAIATTSTDKLGNGSGTADDVDFTSATINTVGPESVTVSDSYAGALGPWTFSDDGSVEYERTFNCAGEGQQQYNNTATIQETKQSDSASVTVNCYVLGVTKDAQPSFTRTWDWTIDKSAEKTDLTLATGQTYLMPYSIIVNASSADSARNVAGNIKVSNPAPVDATINEVKDVLSPGSIAASVDCGVSFPYRLEAGKDLPCSYTANDLPDTSNRTSTATVTLQNYAYDDDSGGDATATATTTATKDFSGSANVTFGTTPTKEIDEQISLSDTYNIGGLGGGLQPNPTIVKASDPAKTFNYNREIGPYNASSNTSSNTSGNYTVGDTATLVTNDTATKKDDSVTVNVDVPANGCTLTIGYWKTHADPTSNRTKHNATGELLAQFGSMGLGKAGATGKYDLEVKDTTTAVKVLNQWDYSSNGAYKLQAQLLAAKLNIANGANGAVVATTISEANNFLATNTKDWDELSEAQKSSVLSLATTLHKYNNGLIRPAHCSEERTL